MEKLTDWNRHSDILEEKKSKSNHFKRHTVPSPLTGGKTNKTNRLRAQSGSIDIIDSA